MRRWTLRPPRVRKSFCQNAGLEVGLENLYRTRGARGKGAHPFSWPDQFLTTPVEVAAFCTKFHNECLDHG
jgi:hypothetical protein